MKKLYRSLVILHAFIGIGAVFPGIGVILDPTGEVMGISTEVLKNGPFDTFLIPGLFLFLVNGLLNIVAARFAYIRYQYQGYFSGVMGVIMMMWIVIQCYVLYDIMILHVIYFILGLILSILALILSIKTHLFPFHKELQ
ncbi:hypothetical protein [Haloplasma contractile]|uniref:Uncharacterized protein n=1 Tax=Haloplasma contractile SSD-17B TaxID=1033810 RepID=U2EAI6_9MOLU|nr:hypothetical protein [Haloplasma contractile]ERJ11841.1 hypothetical protein HLPCO_002080 [Haloplasma contractile SSD-17B]